MHSFVLPFTRSFNCRLACSYTLYSAPELYLDLISSCILSLVLPMCIHPSRECILFGTSFPPNPTHCIFSKTPLPSPMSPIVVVFSSILSWMKAVSLFFFYLWGRYIPLISSCGFAQIRSSPNFSTLLQLQILSGVTDLGRSMYTRYVYAHAHTPVDL